MFQATVRYSNKASAEAGRLVLLVQPLVYCMTSLRPSITSQSHTQKQKSADCELSILYFLTQGYFIQQSLFYQCLELPSHLPPSQCNHLDRKQHSDCTAAWAVAGFTMSSELWLEDIQATCQQLSRVSRSGQWVHSFVKNMLLILDLHEEQKERVLYQHS